MDITKPKINSGQLSAIERLMFGVPITQIYKLIPGLILVIVLARISYILSSFLGESLMGFQKTPISPVMLAILLGMLTGNFIKLPDGLKAGINFALKQLLRLGIIFLGVTLSIFEVVKLGAIGIPIVLTCIIGAIVITTLLNKWLKLPARLGTLIAVGTSICGVSAIAATGPAIEAKEEEVAYSVSVITVFGIIATLTYPYAANLIFDGNAVKIGFFLGTAIHDTSQVTGAALVYSDIFSQPQVLNIATVTKMVRNVFMVAVIPLLSYIYTTTKANESSRNYRIIKLFPFFVVGFLALAIVRSIGDAGILNGGKALGLWSVAVWSNICGLVKNWAVNLLVLALAGIGLNIRFSTFKGLGIKPFIVGFGAAVAVGLLSFGAISVFC